MLTELPPCEEWQCCWAVALPVCPQLAFAYCYITYAARSFAVGRAPLCTWFFPLVTFSTTCTILPQPSSFSSTHSDPSHKFSRHAQRCLLVMNAASPMLLVRWQASLGHVLTSMYVCVHIAHCHRHHIACRARRCWSWAVAMVCLASCVCWLEQRCTSRCERGSLKRSSTQWSPVRLCHTCTWHAVAAAGKRGHSGMLGERHTCLAVPQ